MERFRILFVGELAPYWTTTARRDPLVELGFPLESIDLRPFVQGSSKLATALAYRTLLTPGVFAFNREILARAVVLRCFGAVAASSQESGRQRQHELVAAHGVEDTSRGHLLAQLRDHRLHRIGGEVPRTPGGHLGPRCRGLLDPVDGEMFFVP